MRRGEQCLGLSLSGSGSQETDIALVLCPLSFTLYINERGQGIQVFVQVGPILFKPGYRVGKHDAGFCCGYLAHRPCPLWKVGS